MNIVHGCIDREKDRQTGRSMKHIVRNLSSSQWSGKTEVYIPSLYRGENFSFILPLEWSRKNKVSLNLSS